MIPFAEANEVRFCSPKSFVLEDKGLGGSTTNGTGLCLRELQPQRIE